MSEYEDEQRQCKDCGAVFTWTAGEQAFFAQRELNPPNRCSECRFKKKQEKQRHEQEAQLRQ
jgi:hypothetical protein